MLEFKDILAAVWAAEFPDLLIQEKGHLINDSARLGILLITLLIDHLGGGFKVRESMESLELLSKMTWAILQ